MVASKAWAERSAPVQISEAELPSSIPPQTGLTFNVWYNKWSQGNSGQSRFVSPYRLDVDLHQGNTKGDKARQPFFCLYFCKGMCCMGKRCEYLHHVPDTEDIARLSLRSDVMDCFGREKHSHYREDMGGVGSFQKKNRTLYVGGITGALNNQQLKASQIENRLRFSFGKLGPLERIRYVENKNCAFIKYKHQASAEFAKETMSNQTLLTPSDKEWVNRREGTGLLVKWANDDPNPEAQRREKEQQDMESLQVMVDLLKKDSSEKRQPAPAESPSNKRLLESSAEQESLNGDSIFGRLSNAKLSKLKRVKIEENLSKDSVEIDKQGCGQTPLVNYYSSDDDE
ncbi:active spliceosome conformation promoter CWC2 [Lachancea thermotolerans CBS 6340]|uniref:Pre-mRNA-splicing factor CWC2 n=1 Tax=Lachancea thermotolerans (strain ATCC 56472 / CBS 6340 / NRRL Y-8284) TaxID=559295 RepID=C5DIA0_LACTC|nr:KLTH0E10868p [Lachancea thermotolerans CBS 6340]CAR23511.1 KLTH0E10868p [Lachancea thermotolerans CBS 6340]